MRLQQVELLVKALWVDHENAGYAGELVEVQARRKDYVSDKTLGTVIKALKESYLVPDLGTTESAEDDVEPDTDTARISFRFKSKISMSDEDYAHTIHELETLVEMRNQLVHHFIERFDHWSESGCADAEEYLDSCLKQIDAQFEVMKGWAKVHQEAKEAAAAFFTSEEGRRFMLYGIFPDGTVDWSSTPIVAVLRQAELNLSNNGWTSLNEAVRWLTEKYPDKKPEQYGCSRWRHLLHESGLFEIRRVSSGQPGPTEAYFRSREAQA